MTIAIDSYTAEGPYEDSSQLSFLLRSVQGVYVVLTRSAVWQNWNVVDVGEASNVQNRIRTHDRRKDWVRYNEGVLAIAVIYTPASTDHERWLLEQHLRRLYNPPCGER